MHTATRLDRVLQQLRSFSQLHAAELGALASDLEPIDAELSRRLRVFSETQRDETQLAIDELADVRAGFDATDEAPPALEQTMIDPAVNSPKRARWLAEQAARDEALRRPRSRRQLLGGPPHPPASAPPAAPEA
jgi:hypothetical protein